MKPLLDHTVQKQLESIRLTEGCPLVICDADEVLLQFATAFEHFLVEQGYYLDLKSYALFGNIRHQQGDQPINDATAHTLIASFFQEKVGQIPAVPGAAEALAELSRSAQIVIVSNLPMRQKEDRAAHLAGLGMDYPLIANTGWKGPVVHALATQAGGPAVFVDDIPQNLDSVAQTVAHVHRIHFVADTRLARLVDKPASAHCRIDDWPTAHRYIGNYLHGTPADERVMP